MKNGIQFVAVMLVSLVMAACTGFSVEKFDLGHNVWSDGTKDVHGEEVPNHVYKVVEMYKVNPIGPSYTYHMILRCPGEGSGDCVEIAKNPTLQAGVITGLAPSVISAGGMVGAGALIGSGLSKSGSQTNQSVSGGNANATGGTGGSASAGANATAGAAASSSSKIGF